MHPVSFKGEQATCGPLLVQFVQRELQERQKPRLGFHLVGQNFVEAFLGLRIFPERVSPSSSNFCLKVCAMW
jgi:hypothetical protein